MHGKLSNLSLNEKGESVAEVLLIVFVLVFVIFPVASAVLEKYVAIAKGQMIQDALDITNVAVYNSLSVQHASAGIIDFNSEEALNIYKDLLTQNLKLYSDLSPKQDSMAEGPVQINELNLYTSGFPLYCSGGRLVKRPSVHACVTIPVKPSLYRSFLLNLMGKQYVELKVHVDTELPVDN